VTIQVFHEREDDVTYECAELFCPACKHTHPVTLTAPNLDDDTPIWSLSGTPEMPTLSPSVKIVCADVVLCHFILTDGVMRFQSDFEHDLAGQWVDLPDIPAELVRS